MSVQHKQKRKKKGRPRHTPTPLQRRTVKTMIGFGIPLADVAGVMLIDARTLRRYYTVEIETGRTHAIGQVAQALFKNAVGTPLEIKDAQGRVIERHERAGNVIAQIFFLKCRGNGTWVDKDVKELTGPNGMPLNQEGAKITFLLPDNGRADRPRITDADRLELERELEARKLLTE